MVARQWRSPPDRPHRRNGRKIVPGQKIHASVAFCPKDSRYQPWAILPKDKKWENLVSCGDKTDMRWAREWKDLLEMDFFDIFAADKLISSFQVTETHLHRLKVLSWSGKLLLLCCCSLYQGHCDLPPDQTKVASSFEVL